ncbi:MULTISPECIES: ABC transporter substrate-binding protein [Streptomyces]|uniref:Probable sugar-binding periplasmic protein n=1 Tax=Streptomyces tsukubensis (strain DSM 42081 / NBRC 108919 / NRRL 18488 / 9993) TaxID=1114943 RepID=I2MYC8_STRT9|nr:MULTISPECIES: ABC transporter substrate-binding protein [Streptomyces]AZK94099.1 ABC transporter substrate-binding protein [Streptomyces tsukubensis]EIF89775.1 sugar ABC transporter solute-binding protein [Streptomyces tsukubensis NRRL18488]MYS63519.1 extracellular solute-binding protein [Streptomyces sp. SID5473]QKM69790.1 ABC transporter substrate-binding protein [Streptomyces tsukubensis NRRL18488]TAI46240.1 ABC transporter substrate-binding protein [Streptomyces tsukubensis]
MFRTDNTTSHSPHNTPRSRGATLLAVAAALALLTAGCTGSNDSAADDDPRAKTTLTLWHGWSAPAEVKAIEDNVKRFEDRHPNITVKTVKNMTDAKIQQALRAGGSQAPDVIASFTTDSVGKFCDTGALVDLGPFLKKAEIDAAKVFHQPLLDYTRFDGNQCALPLLNDAYGLYYNKDAFKKAGITAPPKTWSEFEQIAKKLTRHRGDGYEQLGFMPNYHGYETTSMHYAAQWSPTYFDANGKSNVAKDPAFAKMMTFQKRLVDSLGGFAKLEKYRNTFGDEWGAEHPFHTGRVAMQLDGEWRLGMAEDAGVDFEIGTAPLPVADELAADYGMGYLSGTIMGIAATSKKQNAAWELVKYMTTDTAAVVAFANGIRNIPSTVEALESPDLRFDPRFRTFVDIAKHPKSSTTPAQVDGGAYQVTFQDLGYRYESGKVKDLQAGLAETARQIDVDIEKQK